MILIAPLFFCISYSMSKENDINNEHNNSVQKPH